MLNFLRREVRIPTPFPKATPQPKPAPKPVQRKKARKPRKWQQAPNVPPPTVRDSEIIYAGLAEMKRELVAGIQERGAGWGVDSEYVMPWMRVQIELYDYGFDDQYFLILGEQFVIPCGSFSQCVYRILELLKANQHIGHEQVQ